MKDVLLGMCVVQSCLAYVPLTYPSNTVNAIYDGTIGIMLSLFCIQLPAIFYMFAVSLQHNPYLYNQYPGLQAANPMSAAGLGQLPLQFAVSQGGQAANAAAVAAAAAAANLENQGRISVFVMSKLCSLVWSWRVEQTTHCSTSFLFH